MEARKKQVQNCRMPVPGIRPSNEKESYSEVVKVWHRPVSSVALQPRRWLTFAFHTLHRGLQVYREPYDYCNYGLTLILHCINKIQFCNSAVGQFLISFVFECGFGGLGTTTVYLALK